MTEKRSRRLSYLLLGAFAALNGLDLLTTYIAGVQNEMNPAMRALIAQQGFLPFALGKLLLVAYTIVFVILLRRLRLNRWANVYQGIVTSVYVTVVAWNVAYLILR